MSNRPRSSGAMGCLSALLGFLALLAVVVFWPASDPSYLERWLPLTVLFTVCASMVALVLAFTVLSRRYPGRGYAVGGVLLAAGAMLVTALSLHSDVARRESRAPGRCLSNLKQLALAQQMYAGDWNGRLPPASDWVAALDPYTKNTDIFICLADRRRQRQISGGFETSYTMNELCDGLEKGAFERPDETPLLFDGTALYGRDDDAAFRHNDGLMVSFVDGYVKWGKKTWFQDLRWEP